MGERLIASVALRDALRARLGDDRVRRALHPERIAASLAFEDLSRTLAPGELRRRAELSGARAAALPNVAIFERPARDAVVRALAPLVREAGVIDLRAPCDVESVELAIALAEAGATVALRAYGTPGAAAHEAALDRALARLAEIAPGALVRDAAVNTRRSDMAGSLEAYAFGAALDAAEDALARDPGDRDACFVAAVAAHHLGPFDPVCSSAAAARFAVLAEHAADAWSRAHALYRLAVHATRHANDPRGALAFVDHGQRALAGHDDPRAFHLVAWLENARAYASFKQGDAAAATSAIRRALASLEPLAEADLDDRLLDRAVSDTIAHLRANLARAAHARQENR